MREWIAYHTLHMRHGLVRRIAPKVYAQGITGNPGAVVPRPMTIFMREHFSSLGPGVGRPLLGLEIGVASGLNSESFMRCLNMEHLYLVDPWMPYFEQSRERKYYVTNYSTQATMDLCKERLEPFLDRLTFLRMSSDEAVSKIPKDLDFIYIDGNHSFEYVKRDLWNYYPKVHMGGVFGGHDYELPQYQGIVNAVAQFVVKKKLILQGALMDFWVVKP